MHPDTSFMLASDRMRADHAAATLRRQVPSRARPPSRWRYLAAAALTLVAARLTDEPVVVLPRRATSSVT